MKIYEQSQKNGMIEFKKGIPQKTLKDSSPIPQAQAIGILKKAIPALASFQEEKQTVRLGFFCTPKGEKLEGAYLGIKKVCSTY